MRTIIHKRRFVLSIIICTIAIISCSRTPDRLYRIDRDNKYGYIDSLGVEVIPPQYIMAGHFHNGLAFVVTDTTFVHKTDTVDLLGSPMIFSKDSVFVTYGYINKDNHFVIKPNLHYLITWVNPRIGQLRQEDDVLSPKAIISHLEERIGFPADGLAMYQSPEGLYGFINKTGKVIIEAKYKDAKIFSEGKAPVRIDEMKQLEESGEFYITNQRWGCIDIKGNTVIDFVFKSIDLFHNDRSFVEYDATVERNSDIDGELLKDEEGNWIFDSSKAVTGTESRRVPVTNEYIIDEKGNIISDPLRNLFVYGGFTKSGFSTVNPNAFGAAFGLSAYYMDKNGNQLEPGRNLSESEIEKELFKPHKIALLPENAVLTQCDRFSSGYAAVCAGEGKWFFVDTNLIICGKDDRNWLYEEAWPFSNGLAAVRIDGKYGYIDKNFEQVIPCQFDTADYFDGPLAYVTKSRDGVTISSFINKTGKIVWQKIERDI